MTPPPIKENWVYGCTSIKEKISTNKKKNGDVGSYIVTHPTAFGENNTTCIFPIINVHTSEFTDETKKRIRYKPTLEASIHDVVKNGSNVITKICQKHSYTDPNNRDCTIYTTDTAP